MSTARAPTASALAMSVPTDMLLWSGGASGYDANGYGTAKGYQWPASEQDWGSEFNYKGRAPANANNRNPLLKLNIGADGLKTGHTEAALGDVVAQAWERGGFS